MTDVELSDHYCASFDSAVSVLKHVQNEFIRKRNINENTIEIFAQILSSTLAPSFVSVTALLNHFNQKNITNADTIAPAGRKEVCGKKRCKWKNNNKRVLVKTKSPSSL